MNPFKTMLLIHSGFCTGVLLFGAVATFLIAENAHFDITFQSPEPIQFVAPILAVFGLVMGSLMFNKLLASASQDEPDANSKLMKYQTAFIVRCALIETGALANIVAALLTYNILFIGIAALCLTVLWLNRPTRDKVTYTLNLNDTDFL